MARPKSESGKSRRKPATTPEEREHQMVSLAMDLAEDQIKAGVASSQVITHFLKAGSLREQLEQERLEHENKLTEAKIEAMAASQRMEELYGDAIKAMRSYAGDEPPPPPDDEE